MLFWKYSPYVTNIKWIRKKNPKYTFWVTPLFIFWKEIFIQPLFEKSFWTRLSVLLNNLGEFCVSECWELAIIITLLNKLGYIQEISFKTFLKIKPIFQIKKTFQILLCMPSPEVKKKTVEECSINQNFLNQSFSITICNDFLKELRQSGPGGILSSNILNFIFQEHLVNILSQIRNKEWSLPTYHFSF